MHSNSTDSSTAAYPARIAPVLLQCRALLAQERQAEPPRPAERAAQQRPLAAGEVCHMCEARRIQQLLQACMALFGCKQ